MKKIILIICLLMLFLCLTGCGKKPKLSRIENLPDANNVNEMSIWDCDGVKGTYEVTLINPKKWEVTTTNQEYIKEALEVLKRLDANSSNMSGTENLLCFETDERISCIDIHFYPIWGTEYEDDGSLKKVLDKAGLMPKLYVPDPNM